MKSMKTAASVLGLTLGLAALSGAAHAGGFYLQDLSAKQAGDAYSGAVSSQGADALWWNPAAIAGSTGKELSFGAAYIKPSGNVNDSGSVIVRPGQAPASVGGNPVAKDPIKDGVLPNFSFAMPINDRLAFGVTVTAPYSFETQYASNSWTRYNADDTKLTTIDIQPVLAYKVNDWLSIGAGLNIEQAKATLSNKLPNLSPLLADGEQTLQGDGWNTGYTIGAQMHKGNVTVGLSYKSDVKHKLDGNVTVAGLLGPLAASNMTTGTNATFSTPSQAIVGVKVKTTDKLTLNAQLISFGWSKFDYIRLGSPFNQAIPENYRDTISFAVGGDYVVDPKWTVRAGVQYDQTPTRNGHRDARVPDANRIDYAVGTSYQVNDRFAIDAAVTYVAFDDSKLNYTTAAYAGTAVQTPIVINGQLNDAKAVVLSVGGHYNF